MQPKSEYFSVNKILFLLINFFVFAGLIYGGYTDLFVLHLSPIFHINNGVSLAIQIVCFILALKGGLSRNADVGIILFLVVCNLSISAVSSILDGFSPEYGLLTVIINNAIMACAGFLVGRRTTAVYGFLTLALFTVFIYLSVGEYYPVYYPLVSIVILGCTVVMYYYRLLMDRLLVNFQQNHEELVRANAALQVLHRRTELQNIQNRPFVVFGKNTAGLIHDFKNDLSVISSAKSIIQLKIDRNIPIEDEDFSALTIGIKQLEERIEQVKYVTSAREDAPVERIGVFTVLQRSVYPFKLTPEVNSSVEFRFRFRGGEPMIAANRFVFLQICENIIRNSCEAIMGSTGSRNGHSSIAGSIDIGASAVGGIVEISFEDSGPGIEVCSDCEVRNCLECTAFEIGKTTKESGSGFGMVNVIRGVKQLNGTISVYSRLGEGTRIELRFPESGTLPEAISEPGSDDRYTHENESADR